MPAPVPHIFTLTGNLLAERTLTFRAPLHLDVDDLVAALPEGTTVVERTPGLYVLDGDIDPALLASVTAWCAQHGVMPRDLTVAERSLEDVFLDLTGRELRP